MIEDARRANLPETINADVVIIGSGAAGITVALELLDSRLSVVMLEAGGDKFDKLQQDYYRAQAITPETHSPAHMYRRRVFGGSTSVWGGRCIPFDPIDFEERPWMSHTGWPIAYNEVARHYPRALEIAEAGLPQFSAGEALPDEPSGLAPGIASPDVVLDRIERFSHPTHFGSWYRDRLGSAENFRVFTHAPVAEILTDSEGRAATGVRIALPDGGSCTVAAPRVIVATGGIETARLLLASKAALPCGLGNEHDLVGRFYQCHIEGELGEIAFLSDRSAIRMDYQKSTDGIYCRRYLWLSPDAQRRNHLAGLVLRPAHVSIVDPGHRNPVLSAMYLVKNFIVPEYARKMTALEQVARAGFSGSDNRFVAAHIGNVVLGSPRLAAFAFDWTRRRILARRKLPSVVLEDPRAVYPIDINAEQEPNPDSRVILGDEKDEMGMPRIRIDWRTCQADYDRIIAGIRLIQNAVAPSGTTRIDLDEEHIARFMEQRIPIGGHHIGTARMASATDRGVCNPNGELFGTRGLFIAGAAAFPTSSFANPTLTLMALSIRLAEHIRTH